MKLRLLYHRQGQCLMSHHQIKAGPVHFLMERFWSHDLFEHLTKVGRIILVPIRPRGSSCSDSQVWSRTVCGSEPSEKTLTTSSADFRRSLGRTDAGLRSVSVPPGSVSVFIARLRASLCCFTGILQTLPTKENIQVHFLRLTELQREKYLFFQAVTNSC